MNWQYILMADVVASYWSREKTTLQEKHAFWITNIHSRETQPTLWVSPSWTGSKKWVQPVFNIKWMWCLINSLLLLFLDVESSVYSFNKVNAKGSSDFTLSGLDPQHCSSSDALDNDDSVGLICATRKALLNTKILLLW